MKKATRPVEQSRSHEANNNTGLSRIAGLDVAKPKNPRYALAVTANSVTGFDGPKITRRTSAPTTTAGAFFVLVVCNGGCAWETERSAGFRVSRSVNLRTAATLNRLTAIRGSSTQHGATP